MTALRKLNARGIDAFRQYLKSIRAGSEFQPNPAVLYVEETSTPIQPRIEIAPKRFASKLDAAMTLANVLQPIDTPALTSDIGLWAWLALFHFDQLSPIGADGRRRPRQDYHYIPDPGWRHDRHLLAGPYRIYKMHGAAARMLLYPAVHQHGRALFDLASRRDLITNRGLVEAIDLLYWNPRTKRPKRGATTESRPGNLRRLIAVLQQLELNYDLYGMSAKEILALLPEEFSAFQWSGGLQPAEAAR